MTVNTNFEEDLRNLYATTASNQINLQHFYVGH